MYKARTSRRSAAFAKPDTLSGKLVRYRARCMIAALSFAVALTNLSRNLGVI